MMYHWGGDCSYGGVDGHMVNCDAIVSSRTDTLLANGGGALLPSPAPWGYMLPSLVGRPPALSPASSGLPAATSSPFRRAMSTGDLLIRDRDRDRDREEEQRLAAAPGRYSAEERRERIDKYRSKRNQRNFQKKITYACRKTLADSRPRVKGRFARNAGDYTEADADHYHVQAAAPPPQSESEAVLEWWPVAQEAMAEDDQLPAGMNLDVCADDDDDMLAAYLGVSSISLYLPSASTTLPHHHYSCRP